MKYKSELIKEIVETRGHNLSSPHYESECVKSWIEETKETYPKLCDYESEWLNYIIEKPIGNVSYETVIVNPTATINNVVPYEYKSAILKGNTKYRDIDTGDILDTFDETKNLELVSVKMPVLTISNEDGSQSATITIEENITLRAIGDVQDELDLLTGEVVQKFTTKTYNGSENWMLHTASSNLVNCLHFFISVNDIEKSGKVISPQIKTLKYSDFEDDEYISIGGSRHLHYIVDKNKLTSQNLNGFKQWLSQNPFTVQYQLATESIKTVALTPLNKPYNGTNHYHLTANIPCEAILEVPVVSTGKQTIEEINN